MIKAGGLIYKPLHKLISIFCCDYFTNQVLDELLIFRTKLSSKKVRKDFKGRKEMLINIGAGEDGKDGWINVDARNSKGVNCLWDCRRSLPFDEHSAKFIFTEHFIEHIDYYQDAPLLFKDIYRVLKPGGILRIIVPDGQKYLEAYNEHGWETLSKMRPLLEGNVDFWSKEVIHTKMELINKIFRQNYEHRFAYDFETLKHCLANAGFKNIIKQDFNKSLNPELSIDMPIRASESLYVEAIK